MNMPAASTPSDRFRLKMLLPLCGLLGLGLLARLAPLLLQSRLWFSPIQGADSFYHMRRILIALFEPGRLGPIDFYQGLQSAEPCLWPVSYSYLHALVIWGLSLGRPDPQLALRLAALTPPLWGILTAIVLSVLCMRWGRASALVVGAFYLFLPKNIHIASWGQVDHHAAEVFFLALSTWLLVRALEKPRSRAWLPLGLALMGMFLVWSGSTLYLALLSLFVLVWGLRQPEGLEAIARACLLGGMLLLPVSSWNGQSWSLQVSYSHASLFQPVILLAAGLFFLSLDSHLRAHRLRWPLSLLCLSLLAVLALQITLGIDFLFGSGGGYDFVVEIAELQPLALARWPELFTSLTPLLLAAPLFLWQSYQAFRRVDLWPALCGWLFFCALILMFRAERFLYLTSLWAAPLFVWGLITSLNELSLSPLSKRLLPFVIALCSLGAGVPKVFAVWQTPDQPQPELQKMGAWLKAHTPPPAYPLRQDVRPDYTVLAPWDLGHYLVLASQRAVVSNNFGLNAGAHQAFYLAQSEEEALQQLDTHQTRYVLLSVRPLLQTPQRIQTWLGTQPITYQAQNYELTLPAPQFLQSLYARLYFEDGSLGLTNPGAFESLRLVYESESRMPINLTPYPAGTPPYFLLYGTRYPAGFKPYRTHVATYKIFERVPGLRVHGQAQPGAQLLLSGRVNVGARQLDYRQAATANTRGHYRFGVPYRGHFQIVSRAAGSRPLAHFQATESQILTGQVLRLP